MRFANSMRFAHGRAFASSAIKVCETIASFRAARLAVKSGSTIGFVPTMGGLHEGHLSLLKKAREQTDVVVASVFVNPKQFGPTEDFEQYPRTFERDLKFFKEAKTDLVFRPAPSELYPPAFQTYVEPERFHTNVWEGRCRPGFFRGVATVVTKLFHIVEPSHVYFGQKDAVQCVVMKRLIEDLNFPIPNFVIVPTDREENGLARSTRNQYLTSEERSRASVIYRGLVKAEELFMSRKSTRPSSSMAADELRQVIRNEYAKEPLVTDVQYISVGSMDSMEELDEVDVNVGAVLSVAVKLGNCRLIDNIVLRRGES